MGLFPKAFGKRRKELRGGLHYSSRFILGSRKDDIRIGESDQIYWAVIGPAEYIRN